MIIAISNDNVLTRLYGFIPAQEESTMLHLLLILHSIFLNADSSSSFHLYPFWQVIITRADGYLVEFIEKLLINS